MRKDEKKRDKVKGLEVKRRIIKVLSQKGDALFDKKHKFQLMLTLLPRNAAQERIRNRCILSGRSRGVLTGAKVCRVKFRDSAASGGLFGFHKSS